MHGHVHGVSQPMNSYSQVTLAKTSAAQEAAATRRKLLRAAEEMGSDLGSDAVELLGQWGGGGRQQQEGRQQDHERQPEDQDAVEPEPVQAVAAPYLPNPGVAPVAVGISFYV